jgi:acyl-CoA thioesterase-1
MRLAWIVIGCVALAGCGSDRKEASRERKELPPRAAERRPEPDARPVIAAFGDSLTAGHGVDPGRSYPDFLQRELDRRGYAYRVVNAGISGDTSTDGLARLPTVLAHKPEIVILELGANDGLRGLPVAATKANLERLIQDIQASGARIVLAGITLPPNYGPDYIRSFEAMYTDLAARYKLPLIPFLLEGVAGTSRYMQRDGLHPTAEGNRLVAATVLKLLEPLLRKS